MQARTVICWLNGVLFPDVSVTVPFTLKVPSELKGPNVTW
jgi:hypothetical protein